MVSFEVTSMPTTGSLEVLMNDDPIMVGLNALSLNFANAILINPQDGSGGDDHFGALSGNTVFNFAPVLNVNEEEFANFSFYPNPVKNVLTIETQEDLKSVDIYNVNGQRVLKRDTKSIDMSSLQSGFYFAKITTEKANATIKLIKK